MRQTLLVRVSGHKGRLSPIGLQFDRVIEKPCKIFIFKIKLILKWETSKVTIELDLLQHLVFFFLGLSVVSHKNIVILTELHV